MLKYLIQEYWKNIVILILLLFICCSCDVMKQSTKSKGEISASEQIENKTFRKGDTVSYAIPKITYKDTTIYTTNRQGTTLRTVYDERGQVSNIDCFASAIEEISRQNREFFEQFKDKQKEKEEKFDSSFILYIVGGLVVLGIVALFLFYKTINKNSKAIDAILNKIA
jgi:uncharacterized membrane protein